MSSPVISAPTLQTATLTLTSAEINALSVFSTKTLVPAPLSTQIIIPITFSASLNYSTTFTGGGNKIEIRMGTNNTLWNTAIIDTPQTTNRFASGLMGWVGNYGDTSNYTAKSIVIAVPTVLDLETFQFKYKYTGGTGSTITFTCVYYVLDL